MACAILHDMQSATTAQEDTMTATCTIGSTDNRCGATAVVSGTFGDGTAWACCAAHATAADYRAAAGSSHTGDVSVGDHVQVRRYGKVYDATVSRVGARGAVYATFTYDNGATRTVRVDG